MWIIRICYPAFFIDLEGNNILEMRTERMSLRIASYTIYFIPIAKRAVFLFKHTHEDNITWIDPIIAKRHGVLGNHSQKRNAWNIGRYPRLRFQRGGNHLFWKCECIPNIPCIGYDIGTIICTEGCRIFFLFCCCCESQLVKSSAKGKNVSAMVKRAALPQNARRDCCAAVRRECSSSSCMF